LLVFVVSAYSSHWITVLNQSSSKYIDHYFVVMLESWKISCYYIEQHLEIPNKWKLRRKHIRIQTLDKKFIKLNQFENRIKARELNDFCVRFSPSHVYFSGLDYLFPERVGKKNKANFAYPVNGEYVIDIDSYLLHRWHKHKPSKNWNICNQCLESAKYLTVKASEMLEEYYKDISIVFSGKNGFHIHVHDFKIRDWTRYNQKNPIKSHEVARFKFTKLLNFEIDCFDRHHFIVSTDPMRIITVPETLNAESGLICRYIGNRKEIERKSVDQIVKDAVPFGILYGYPEPSSKAVI
jgi:hypothetical protein